MRTVTPAELDLLTEEDLEYSRIYTALLEESGLHPWEEGYYLVREWLIRIRRREDGRGLYFGVVEPFDTFCYLGPVGFGRAKHISKLSDQWLEDTKDVRFPSACPKCHVPVGSHCVSLSSSRKSPKLKNSPHPERAGGYKAAETLSTYPDGSPLSSAEPPQSELLLYGVSSTGAGAVLKIGITSNLPQRLAQHACPPYFLKRVEFVASHSDAQAVESLIKGYLPLSGFKAVQGTEYFDAQALGLVLSLLAKIKADVEIRPDVQRRFPPSEF